MESLSIFDLIYDEYKIKKPIKLIELFGGYGSQALALKYLKANFEHHKLCEWAIPSIIAYADVHKNELPDYGKDFANGLTKVEIAQKLFEMGVSVDYNKPAKLEQLKRMPESKLKLIYNSIIWEHNLVDVSRVKGSDLEIISPQDYAYLLTYSFPCQDLSLAGKGAGMEKGSGTRSGLLWEVERILSECETKPEILLMENVPQVHGSNNEIHFKQWQLRLEEMGYQSYWEDLSATDFLIPQSRNRTFMISILGDYNYNFPKKKKLKLKLKDLREPEDSIDEKFYLSDKLLNCFMSEGTGKYPRRERFLQNLNRPNQDIANSITTAAGNRATDNFVVEGSKELKGDTMGICIKEPRICASRGRNPENPSSREKGQKLEQRIEIGPEGVSNTLTTVANDNYLIEPKVIKVGNYMPSNHNVSVIVDGDGVAPTVMENHGTVTATVVGGIGEKKSNNGNQWYQQDRVYDDKVACAVTTSVNPYYINDYRIRKLTPRECFRLQGVKDIDSDAIMTHQSNALGYHLSGDSICVTVLMAIFGKLLDKNLEDYFNEREWWNNGN